VTIELECDAESCEYPQCGCDPSLCDEHEWAGVGDCPGCLRDYPEEVTAMHKRMGLALGRNR
jgi:hypothetical protein